MTNSEKAEKLVEKLAEKKKKEAEALSEAKVDYAACKTATKKIDFLAGSYHYHAGHRVRMGKE